MSEGDGGPAFPVGTHLTVPADEGSAGGMSLLDYFASKAMQAIISKSALYQPDERPRAAQLIDIEAIAAGAYDYARAMLAERERAK